MDQQTQKIIKSIVRWITQNCECESALLHRDPQHLVNARRLLHFIAVLTKTHDDVMEAWVDQANDDKQEDTSCDFTSPAQCQASKT